MKKTIIRLICVLVGIYAVYTLVAQQKLLNSYAAEKNEYTNQIYAAEKKQNELNTTLESINSTNYIEDVARNKLDIYLPNERVYIDITK